MTDPTGEADKGALSLDFATVACQEDLVRHAKIAKKTIADFERGVTTPRRQTLARIVEPFSMLGSVARPMRCGSSLIVYREGRCFAFGIPGGFRCV